MSNNFKKQVSQARTSIPQVDPETVKPAPASIPVNPVPANPVMPPVVPVIQESQPEIEKVEEPVNVPQPDAGRRLRITQVDTSETPTNRGFSMYPSRHRQIAKDIAYLEDRYPWEVIEDALEEYVIKHYGKDYKRK